MVNIWASRFAAACLRFAQHLLARVGLSAPSPSPPRASHFVGSVVPLLSLSQQTPAQGIKKARLSTAKIDKRTDLFCFCRKTCAKITLVLKVIAL
jgi:hypothetical protein